MKEKVITKGSAVGSIRSDTGNGALLLPKKDCGVDAELGSGSADEVDSVSWALLESVLGVQRRDVARFHGESCSEWGGSSAPGGPPSNIVAG
eukprot:400332-Ditylum_brightwellii.AAC.1